MNEFFSKFAIIVVLLTAAFATGRYTAQKTIQQTSTTKTDTEVNTDKTVRTVTKVVYVERPDGTKETDTTTTTDSTTKTTKSTDTIAESTKTSTPAGNTLNVSLLGGISTQSSNHPITYGVSVQKQIIGPLSAGLFGLNNGTVGLSVGINF